MRDMTIGQYYSVDSKIHSLDPRVKIIITFVYVISLLFIRSIYVYAFAFIVLASYIRMSNVPIAYIARGTKALIGVIVLTVVFQLFTVQGARTIFEWKMIKISENGLLAALRLLLRLVFMIIGSSMMTYTTTPTDLTD